MWIRPLLHIKLDFMAAYSVILCEDSSSTLWIRPFFFFVVVFVHYFKADSSALITGDLSPLF